MTTLEKRQPLPKITKSELAALQATSRGVVYVYPRKKLVSVNGMIKYRLA